MNDRASVPSESLHLEGSDVVRFLDQVIRDYEGDAQLLEAALGAFMLARHLGHKPLFILHNKKTIKSYQEILGIKFKDAFPAEGTHARRSPAYVEASAKSNFWKVVAGSIALESEPRRHLKAQARAVVPRDHDVG